MAISRRLRRRDFLRAGAGIIVAATSVAGSAGRGVRSRSGASTAAAAATPSPSAIDYLAAAMDRFHRTVDVYTDAHAAGNHFVARGRLSSFGAEDAVQVMDEASTDDPAGIS